MNESTKDKLAVMLMGLSLATILLAAVLGVRHLFLYISSLEQRIEVLEQKK